MRVRVLTGLRRTAFHLKRSARKFLSPRLPVRLKTALKGAARPLAWMFGRDRVVRVASNGHDLLIPRRFVEWHVMRGYEPLTGRLFTQTISPGAVVLDIGAHVGHYTLLAAHATGPDGRVFAFEPATENFELLRRNIRANGYKNVVALQKAVASRSGRRMLLLSESPDSHGFYEHPLSPARGTYAVDCVSVDDFIGEDRVDVVKIDIEGAESEALEGMDVTLDRNRDLVLFLEFNPSCIERAGVDPAALIGHLTSVGFDIRIIDDRAGSVYAMEDVAKLPLDDPTWYANLLCTRD